MARTTTTLIWITALLMLCSGVRALAASAVAVESGLLFAGLDASIVFQQTGTEDGALKRELVGIIVDGRELDTMVAYRIGDDFYLPSSVLRQIGVHGAARTSRLYLMTPGGEVETQPHFFRDIQDQMYFNAAMLDEVLKVRWEFSPEKYALTMTLPWWQQGLPGNDMYADGGTTPD